jgi:ribulose-phosphate 3-epimerase
LSAKSVYALGVTRASLIAPSILAADFARLGDEVSAVAPHVDMIHIDVMDGHFVPNITFGIPIIRSLRPVTDLKFDCHLMMLNPDFFFAALREAGADMVTVHMEVFPNPTRPAALAKAEGLEFGLVLNPPTPFEAVEPYIELADMLLVMSVNPGFGGQSFIAETMTKITAARNFVESHGLATDIEVDGGIGRSNIRRVRDAGANVFVAGSSIFGEDDPAQAAKELRNALETEGA